MKNTLKELGDSKVEITVEVDSEAWVNAQKKEFEKALGQVQIKGFRKGKAPKAMAAGHVDQNRVLNAALDSLLNPVYAQALAETHVQPYSRPEVNVAKVSDTELTLVFTLVTMPKVHLGTYTGLAAERAVVSVSEEEIASSISKRLSDAAELEVVEREAKVGDTVVLDFEGFIDGTPFEGGKADNYSLELGSHAFVPGFEEALVGVKAGDSKDVDIVFPEQYVAELAGKAAVFKCAIHEIKEKKVPALSDEAVKDLGIQGVETVEALKEFTKKEILTDKNQAADNSYFEAILKQVVANATVEIASSIIDAETARSEENTRKQIENNGLTMEQYLQITGQTEEALRAQLRAQSEEQLKAFLVQQAIAAKEHLIVDDAELDVELSKMAEQYGMKLEDIKKALGSQIESFRENLQGRKIREFLIANNGAAAKASAPKPEEAAPAEEKPAPKAKKAAPKAKKPATAKKAAKPADDKPEESK